MAERDRVKKRMSDRNILCCVDLNTSGINGDIHQMIGELHRTFHTLHKFGEWNACIDFITGVYEDDIIYLVTIARYMNYQLLPLFDSLNQVKVISLLCDKNDRSCYDEWKKCSCKVIIIQSGSEDSGTQIERNIRQNGNQLISFQTFSPLTSGTAHVSSLNRLDSSFMYSQLIKEMLVDAKLEYDEDYMDIFVDACRTENQDNDAQLANITRFRDTYKEHSAVWWYTKESFLYSTVNKALRTQDVTTLFMMGFFIRDLHLQLVELQQSTVDNQFFSMLYRGQGMSGNDFQRARQHIGGLFSFNNFLSTTSDFNVSLMFARSARDNPLHVGILFRIKYQQSVETNKEFISPFASLHNVSYYPHEDEILFSMHTIFRIVNIQEIDERLWQMDLDLSNDQDERLSVLLGRLRSEIHITEVFSVD
jgi:hypothetical protein